MIITILAVIFIAGIINTQNLPCDVEEKEFIKLFFYNFFGGSVLLIVKITKYLITKEE